MDYETLAFDASRSTADGLLGCHILSNHTRGVFNCVVVIEQGTSAASEGHFRLGDVVVAVDGRDVEGQDLCAEGALQPARPKHNFTVQRFASEECRAAILEAAAPMEDSLVKTLHPCWPPVRSTAGRTFGVRPRYMDEPESEKLRRTEWISYYLANNEPQKAYGVGWDGKGEASPPRLPKSPAAEAGGQQDGQQGAAQPAPDQPRRRLEWLEKVLGIAETAEDKEDADEAPLRRTRSAFSSFAHPRHAVAAGLSRVPSWRTSARTMRC